MDTSLDKERNHMDLFSLWLPILLSAAAVWIVAAIVWMALPHHKNDFIRLPDEDGFMDDLRKRGIKPGNYVFPDFRGRDAMKSEKVCKALEEGPVGHLSLWQPPLGMAGKMVGTFLVYLVVRTLIAYLASITLPKPADFSKVFQVVGTAGILAYSFAFIPNGIWFGAYKRTIVAGIIDGIVFGLITGAIFAWGWPH
ncbi:MAG: hypothetical protein IPK83_04650 [Planctomycetes bacterium]|nr:hypothetical protein [Planctomycetota bacterium]